MASTGAPGGDTTGDWQEVRRRKPYPTNWRISQPTQPKARPYLPYSKPTYAQVLLRSPPPPNTMAGSTRPSPASSQPSSPTSQNSTIYYVSPHSPSRLRFPPSHTFPEWKGRCFRCCRTGHSAAKCRNPKRCGKCWSYGHIGSKCKQHIVPPPQPTVRPAPPPSTSTQAEPEFDELLMGSYPYRSPEMPKERPIRLHCFIPRDDEYYAELARLKQAVVMHTRGFQWELTVDNVCDYACRTNLVTKNEIQISELSGSRFLILLPEGLDPDTFINATPQSAWDEGISFQPWTPLEDAAISIPAYKILLNLVGIPPHLFKEKNVAHAVGRFGVFLGSVTPEKSSSLASWIVAVGVDDLTLVPPELVMHAGGLMHTVQVHTLAYQRVPLYTVEDMPKHPKKYRRPQPPPSSSGSSDNGTMNDDIIPLSSHVIRELCRGKTADNLPPELRQFATMEELDLDHTHMATQEDIIANLLATNQEATITVRSEAQITNSQQRFNMPTDAETGHAAALVPHSEQATQISHHIQSGRISTSISQSAKLMEGSEIVRAVPTPQPHVAGQKNIQYLGPNHVTTQNNSQRILLQGDSSKPKATDGVPKPKSSDLPLNQRRILSRNGNNSKDPGMNSRGNQGVIIFDITAPAGLESSDNGHVITERNNGLLFQAKGKAQIGGKSQSGPNTRKFKWVRPVPPNVAHRTKQIIAGAGQKRKKNISPPAKPVKRFNPKLKCKEQAEASFNSEGFYEVKVHYEHISNLAAGCGFTTDAIEEVIKADNDQRQIRASQPKPITSVLSKEEEAALARFEPDSADDLSSEEEEG